MPKARRDQESEPGNGEVSTEAILSALGEGVSVQDRNFRIVYQNHAHAQLHGSHTGEYCFKAYVNAETVCEGCPVAITFEDGAIHTVKKSRPAEEGVQHVEITAYPLRNSNGKVTAAIEIVRDITEQKRAEDELQSYRERLEALVETKTRTLERKVIEQQNTESKLREALVTICEERGKSDAIIAAIGDGISIQNTDFVILYENQVHKDILGNHIGEFCYKAYSHRDSICEDCPSALTLKDGKIHRHQRCVDTPDGKRYFDITTSPLRNAAGKIIAAIEVVRDSTEHRKMEELLQQTQKMEAIGTLTGGIAHEFNNILMAIMGNGHLVKTHLDEGSPLFTYVDHILASSQRGASLTQSLLAFSRKQVISLIPVNINDIVIRMAHLLKRLIEDDIELNIETVKDDLFVTADAGQIDQILMNLCSNARDAMPNGGTVSIKTGMVELDRGYIESHGYGRPGLYASLSVTDTGIGMNEATRERIFEPFFTTKEVGKGTGLGLAMVYGIVKQHGGYVNCSSSPGKGTVLTLYLPLMPDQSPEQKTAVQPLPKKGVETLLLAEDDEQVRKLLASVLKDRGYEVIESADGEDAVSKFMEHKDSVHLLIFDVVMPRMNGKEAYDAIRSIKADIKVLFISGYATDVFRRRGILDKNIEIISKPIMPNQLLEKVRALLDSTPM